MCKTNVTSLPQTELPMSLKEIRAHFPLAFKKNCKPIVCTTTTVCLKLLPVILGICFRMSCLILICYWFTVPETARG